MLVQNEKYSTDTRIHYLSDLHVFSLTIQYSRPHHLWGRSCQLFYFT